MSIAKTILGRAIFVLIAIFILGSGSVKADNVEYLGSTLWNSCQKTVVVGDYAYSTFQDGLQITDVSSPSNPVVIGQAHIRMVEYDGYNWVIDLAVYGDYVYWTTNHDLLIIDVTDRTNPTVAGEFDIPGITYIICIEGNYAYISGSGAEYNFWILDISNPLYPEIAGGLHLPSVIYEINVIGDYAYIANGDNGIQVINVSDPNNPVITGGFIVDDYLLSITVSGDLAFTTSCHPSMLFVFDIADPFNPFLVESSELNRCEIPTFALGSLFYYFDSQLDVNIADYSDPNNPFIVGTFEFDFILPNHLFIEGNNAFVSDDFGGVHILNVANPTEPELMANLSTTRWLRKNMIVGEYAYIVDSFKGMFVVDISDPEYPTLISRYFHGDSVFGGFVDIAIQDNYAFLAKSHGGDLHIVDISDPFDPAGVSTLDLPGSNLAIFVSEHYAYLANYDSSLYVIDILDPSNPQLIGEYSTSSPLADVYISEDYAYISGYWCGIEILDISDPSGPVKIGNYGDYGGGELVVTGDLLYRVTGSSFSIIDVSDPYEPNLISYLYTEGDVQSIFLENNLVYLGIGSSHSLYGGLLVINAAVLSNPIIVERNISIQGPTESIVKRDDYIYASTEHSFQILQYTNSGCVYGIGDYNGSHAFNIADIISAFSKLKTGSPEASLLCECPPGSGDVWAVAMDLNNSCSFNVADVIAGFSKLKTGSPELEPCEACPPEG
ncbi:MAG: hypothetical protein V3W18_04400 [candidate division Zixibacteria bacterium]